MNFESKLNNDLQWSPKFREMECTLSDSGVVEGFDDPNCMVEIREFTSGNKEILASVVKYMRDGLLELCRVTYFDDINNPELDPHYCRSRIGGPYMYDMNADGEICNIKYMCFGIQEKPYQYWSSLSEIWPEFYNQTQKGNIIYFHAPKRNPHPYSYNLNSKQFTWKLYGKRVRVSQFWKHWETQFIGLKYYELRRKAE